MSVRRLLEDRFLTYHSRKDNEQQLFSGLWSTALLLGILRVVRAWNQTGQKHAGKPDIARNVLPSHNIILVLVVLATYLLTSYRFLLRLSPRKGLATALSMLLCLITFMCKINFTKADAPELLVGLDSLLFESMSQKPIRIQVVLLLSSIGVWTFLHSFPDGWIPPGLARNTQRK